MSLIVEIKLNKKTIVKAFALTKIPNKINEFKLKITI
jgi:hypothetical protein